jgi:hypothetical protein
MLSRKRISSLMIIAVVSAIPSIAAAQAVYTGATGGDWGTFANWSTGIVPGGGDNVVVDNRAGNFIVLTGVNVTRASNNLTINLGDAVELSNNSNFNLGGNLSGGGTFRFNVLANRSTLAFGSATATIAAGTLIDFNYQGAPNADGRITGPGSGTLTNSGSIRGSGTFDNIRFTNAVGGLLENYQTSAQMYLDANNGAAGLFVNQGTIRALAGSTVTFAGDSGGDFNSAGGLIQANGSGAVVRFVNSANVAGGTYSTTGGGEVVVEAGHTGSASNFSNSGTMRVRNNAHFNIAGAVTNTGTLTVSPGVNYSYLTIAGDTTLSGAGTTTLNSNGAARAVLDGGGVLTIAAGHTIRGDGYFNNLRVINNGTIIGDDSTSDLGGTYLDPNNGGGTQFTNNGTIQVTANNFLSLVGDSGGIFSGPGTYRADGANAFLHLANSVTVEGGTYTTTGGGEIRVPIGHAARANNFNLTAGSTLAELNNTRLYVNGTPTVNGTIDVRAGANNSYLSIESDTTLAGSGKIVLNGNPGVSSAMIDGGGLLTIPSTFTISGNGYINNVRVQNNGLILADRATGSMYLDPNNGGGVQFVNSGTVKAVAGATISLVGDNGGVFSGSGTYLADGANAFINMFNSATVVGGTVTTSNGGVVQVLAGHIATMQDTTVSAGSTLTVANNARLNMSGSPVFNGALSVNAAANNSYLTINNTTNLNVGTLLLNGNPGVSNAQIDGAGVLSIGPNFTVSGNGYFNNVKVTNAGTILADRATGSMYLDPNNGAGGAFVNNGVIKSSTGATTTLSGDNGGGFQGTGVYRADGANAIVQFINSIGVTDGTYTTTAGGLVQVAEGQTGYFGGTSTLTAASTFSVLNNATLRASGTIVNNGTLSVLAAANNSNLITNGDLTLSGPGITRLTSASGVRAVISGGDIVTIASGHTVAGNGYINNVKTINNGLILADQASGDMYLDPNNGGGIQFQNNAVIRAAAGATLNIAGDNGGVVTGAGTYVADAGGTIQSINSLGGDSGQVSGAGTYKALSSSNAGHTNYRVANLVADTNGTARITAGGGNAGTSVVNTLTTAGSGRVDVTDHGVVVDYTGTNPVATLRGYIATGRNGGFWNGAGIMSSLATNANGKAVGYAEASEMSGPNNFLGQVFDPTSVLIRYTVNGDATLDGQVQFADLVKLAQNYETAGAVSWNRGDFNYDGTINFADLVILAQNYNQSLILDDAGSQTILSIGGETFAADLAVAQSMVPEPASLSLLAAAACVAARRRR